MNITIAGIGYVGLSLAILLSQNNNVIAVDIDPYKINLLNNKKSPIDDKDIENYLIEKKLNLIGTLDAKNAYANADIIIISTPTNYIASKRYFDTSSIENVLDLINLVNRDAIIVIKSTVPVGYLESICAKYPNLPNLLFSPEFLREGHALYDNLHPSRIIVGVPKFCNEALNKKAQPLKRLSFYFLNFKTFASYRMLHKLPTNRQQYKQFVPTLAQNLKAY